MSYHLNKNDSIYLFSDGYADQFGGPEGKKFMTANIRKLLLDIHHLPMEEQARRLRDTFIEWKGDQEQVDDVVFLGLRV
jgi:serine phosphatase RsbU (regulator of sigma subunit)